MARSFGLVEDKIDESDFFLEKIADSDNIFELKYYLSAFYSASRSITFALQASLNDLEGFKEWYKKKQEELKEDNLARFFYQARNISQKVGHDFIYSGTSGQDQIGNSITLYYFDQKFYKPGLPIPEEDIVTCCRQYLITLIELIYDCFQVFGDKIDPEQYYTPENLKKIGRTIEDVEEEFGLPRGWTRGKNDIERLKIIRHEQTNSQIDRIFLQYLGKDKFGRSYQEFLNDKNRRASPDLSLAVGIHLLIRIDNGNIYFLYRFTRFNDISKFIDIYINDVLLPNEKIDVETIKYTKLLIANYIRSTKEYPPFTIYCKDVEEVIKASKAMYFRIDNEGLSHTVSKYLDKCYERFSLLSKKGENE